MRKNNLLNLRFFTVILLILAMHSSIFAGNKLRIALGGQLPTTIDPSNFNAGDVISGNVFDSLVAFSIDNKLIPQLAVSWKHSADGKILEMKLRKGVLFSSGAPFTAKDVVFSLNRNAKNNMGIQDQLKQNYSHVEAADDYTVRFVFTKPNAQFLFQTCARLYIISETDYNKTGEEGYLRNPIGTGPYKFAEWKAGQYADLVANKNYWGKKPQIQEARYILTPNNATRISMLKAGEADLITNVAWESVPELEENGYSIIKTEGGHAQALVFGMMNPNTPWANVKVRQAINYCIDKDAIIKQMCFGVPFKLQWQSPWELGYDAGLKPAYPYNINKAKQLMKEAGYPEGFEMPLIYLSDVVGLKNITDYISNSLKQIGINCTLTGLKFGTEFFGKMRELHSDPNGKAAVFFEIGGPGTVDPVITLTNQYYSKKPSGLYSTTELDGIIEKALQTVNDKQREKLIRQAYKIIDKDLPLIHVLGTVYVYATQKNVIYKPSTKNNGSYSVVKDTIFK